MRILISVSFFTPAFRAGGPVRSLSYLLSHLKGDFEFLILTSDRDLGDSEPYAGLPRDQWVEAHGAQVRYCSPGSLTPWGLAKILRETPHDLLYLNSFFSSRFTIALLMARRFFNCPAAPVLLAPRGEFSPGALAINHVKKQAYIQVGKALGLFRDIFWHASTEHEKVDIQAKMAVPDGQVGIACNLAAPLPAEPPFHALRAKDEPLRVLFLSRISPKKNLGFAFDVLKNVSIPIRFTVMGPEEDVAYSERCREQIRALPDHVIVDWVGAIPHDKVANAMVAHDLFFLPTQGENFGHVIAEALGVGTPVLISDTTPWRGLAEKGIGFDISLETPAGFHEALSQIWKLGPEEYAVLRVNVFAYAQERQRTGSEVEAHRTLFLRVLADSGFFEANLQNNVRENEYEI
ncbi:glycosyltransferase [Microbulbifer pacificus]|uniref:Glycosyltransferase n=1 Tax=Microbulbifer pacificus TaxID=407164 RepID=A0AAU0MZW6_9GAMM|nr:glycosyltransferase [Microbulbifer pacificus]WOX05442.1 glycosyltransferase [Microbulbifer pacificus]